MGNLFSGPKIKPDPAAQAAAARQSNIADSQLTDAVQGGLLTDTRARLRQFGIQPAGTGYGGSFRGGAGGGGGSGGGGGGLISNWLTSLNSLGQQVINH